MVDITHTPVKILTLSRHIDIDGQSVLSRRHYATHATEMAHLSVILVAERPLQDSILPQVILI